MQSVRVPQRVAPFCPAREHSRQALCWLTAPVPAIARSSLDRPRIMGILKHSHPIAFLDGGQHACRCLTRGRAGQGWSGPQVPIIFGHWGANPSAPGADFAARYPEEISAHSGPLWRRVAGEGAHADLYQTTRKSRCGQSCG